MERRIKGLNIQFGKWYAARVDGGKIRTDTDIAQMNKGTCGKSWPEQEDEIKPEKY